MAAPEIEAWLDELDRWLAPQAEVRLLFSRPLLGPSGCLREWQRSRRRREDQRDSSNDNGQAALAELEQSWLSDQHQEARFVAQGLEQRGWQVHHDTWRESLSLTLGAPLLERWFAEEAPYRLWLETQLDHQAIDALRQTFRAALGAALPQPLEHTLLRAHRIQAPRQEEPSPTDKKKPRGTRGVKGKT
jgi:putative ATPase